MTASITGRKRCGCGQYKTPLANGTMPRHTHDNWDTLAALKGPLTKAGRIVKRVHCEWSGKFPPADQRWSKNKSDKPRGQARRTRRVTKRERKGHKR